MTEGVRSYKVATVLRALSDILEERRVFSQTEGQRALGRVGDEVNGMQKRHATGHVKHRKGAARKATVSKG
jgi:hypothetical protein